MTSGSRPDSWPDTMRRTIVSISRRYSFINWAFGDQAIVSASNLITTILLARFLGIEDFGRLTLAWIVINVTGGLHHTLVISPMMSISPKQTPADLPAYFGAVVAKHAAFVVCTSLLIFVGTLVLDAIFPSWNVAGLAIPLAIFNIATNIHEFVRRYFYAKGLFVLAFKTDVIRYAVQIGLLLTVSRLTSLDPAMGFWLMSASAIVAFAIYVSRLEHIRWNSEIARTSLRRHWKYSSWLSLALSTDMILDYIYFSVAGAILGPAAVGAVNASRALIGVFRIVTAGSDLVLQAQAPRRYHEGGVHALVRYLTKMAVFLAVLAVGMTLVIVPVPEFWLRVAFGAEYAGYGNLVLWWTVIHLLYIGVSLLTAGLFAIERTKAMFVGSVLAALCGMAGAYPMVTLFGLNGVLAGIFAMAILRFGVLPIALYRNISRLKKEIP